MRKQDLPTSSLTNVYSAQPTSGRIYYPLMRRIQLYLFLLTNSIRCRPFSVCHSSVGSPRCAKNPREEGVMPYRTPTLANSHQTLHRNKYKHTLKQYQLWEMEGGERSLSLNIWNGERAMKMNDPVPEFSEPMLMAACSTIHTTSSAYVPIWEYVFDETGADGSPHAPHYKTFRVPVNSIIAPKSKGGKAWGRQMKVKREKKNSCRWIRNNSAASRYATVTRHVRKCSHVTHEDGA